MPRRSKADLDALKPLIIAALAAGETKRAVAERFNVSPGTVGTWMAGARAVAVVQDYREIVVTQAKAYAAQTWKAMDVHVRILADEAWVREHPGESFGLASAQRVLGETLARILAVV